MSAAALAGMIVTLAATSIACGDESTADGQSVNTIATVSPSVDPSATPSSAAAPRTATVAPSPTDTPTPTAVRPPPPQELLRFIDAFGSLSVLTSEQRAVQPQLRTQKLAEWERGVDECLKSPQTVTCAFRQSEAFRSLEANYGSIWNQTRAPEVCAGMQALVAFLRGPAPAWAASAWTNVMTSLEEAGGFQPVGVGGPASCDPISGEVKRR
jgi:hypothetical protein